MNEPDDIKQPARRRLAKGALAGTAVLASITSKNALGASYACTVSGQHSGNLSRAGETVSCMAEFGSLRDWQEAYARGQKKDDAAPHDFGITYLDPKYSAPGSKRPVPSPSWATIKQILNGVDGLRFRGGDAVLAQAAMVVYLNAGKYRDYHVTPARSIELYEGATGSGMPLRGGNVVWDANRCAGFLKMLAGLA